MEANKVHAPGAELKACVAAKVGMTTPVMDVMGRLVVKRITCVE